MFNIFYIYEVTKEPTPAASNEWPDSSFVVDCFTLPLLMLIRELM